MTYKEVTFFFLVFISACVDESANPPPATDESIVFAFSFNGEAFEAESDILIRNLTLLNATKLSVQSSVDPTTSAIYFANSYTASMQTPIARSGCALYNLTLTDSELQCAAPSILADVPANSQHPALGFDADGNLLVTGRRFTTHHTDTCLQPTATGCAAWQVNYGLDLLDEYPKLYRVTGGQIEEIDLLSGDMALGSFSSRDGLLHVLNGTFAGYALHTSLIRLDPASGNQTDLGEFSALLPSENGLLWVNPAGKLQISTLNGQHPLTLPMMPPASDVWFNPAPQALTFDRQGQLYGLFQQRRHTAGGEWQEYVVNYRLLPYNNAPLSEIPVDGAFFTDDVKRFAPITIEGGYVWLACHSTPCTIFAQTTNGLHNMELPADFRVQNLMSAQGNIILDGQNTQGQAVQLQLEVTADAGLAITKTTVFPTQWQSVVTIPLPAPAAATENLSITAVAQTASGLSLSFNQALNCAPALIHLQTEHGAVVFTDAFLQQGASLHLFDVPQASAIEIDFHCDDGSVHLQHSLTEDSLAI
jgi:hypothetical protein